MKANKSHDLVLSLEFSFQLCVTLAMSNTLSGTTGLYEKQREGQGIKLTLLVKERKMLVVMGLHKGMIGKLYGLSAYVYKERGTCTVSGKIRGRIFLTQILCYDIQIQDSLH